MSGHSKWSTIKRAKGAADAKRGALFTRLGNQITVASREGGGDPEMNFKLKLAIDMAKAGNLPKDNIERAIKRGTGELAGEKIEEIIYEGFGPDGVAIMLQALTDNRNRTSAAVKHLFSKFGGSLGAPNAVGWMFEKRGLLRLPNVDQELELALIDAGVEDIIRDEEGATILTQPNDLQKIKAGLESQGKQIQYAEIEFVAKEEKQVSDNHKASIEKLLAAFDEEADVNNVYTNAKLD